MGRRFHIYIVAASGGLLLALLGNQPLRADQIVALVDEHGHKIYINTGDMPTRADWMTRSFRKTPTTHSAHPPTNIDQLVQQASDRYQVDPQLVHAMIKAESGYDPKAVSNKGAMGLMQLIPATAHRYGVDNPFDPEQNIAGGVTYLKHLLDLFGGDLKLSLAAYNAGENAVLRAGDIPAFQETRQYVRKVTNLYSTGPLPTASKPQAKGSGMPPIVRYVDTQGVVHYTNVD